MKFIQNKYDRYIFTGILFVLYTMYFAWLLTNLVRSNNVFIWLLSIPICLFLASKSSHSFITYEENEVTKRTKLVYFIFFILLGGVLLYYLEPLFRNPISTIGIPFKDMQDAMAVFIKDFGFQPSNEINSPSTKFITNIFFTSHQPYYQNIYFGYPNVLHSFSALLMKLGVFEFHATWLATVSTIFITSCSLFLILKSFKNTMYSAIVSGLFGISSFRVLFSIIASIVMAFSIGLILPVLLVVLVSIHHYKDKYSYITPVIALSLLAASFTNAIFFLLSILIIYAIMLVFFKHKREAIHLGKIGGLILLTIPLYIFAFSIAGSSYFGGTFHIFQNNVDFDPNELSQRILPLDTSLYMIFFSFSMGMYALNLIRKKILLEKNVFQTFIFLVNIGLLIPIVYDYLFTHINSITSAADLVTLHPAGIFGGLMHFLMHRVALLQPIFFIFFVADLFSYIKGKWALAAGGIVTMIMLMSLVIKTDGLFYENIQSELRPDFYNVTNRDNQFTLLSDWRLITDENMWNESIFKALSYLKLVTDTNTTILLLDKRNWTEETIANWGSVLLRNKISIPKEKGIGEDWKTDMNVNYSRIVKSNYQYTLFINKIDEENKNAPQPELGERVFSESNVMLFKIH